MLIISSNAKQLIYLPVSMIGEHAKNMDNMMNRIRKFAETDFKVQCDVKRSKEGSKIAEPDLPLKSNTG